MSKGSKADQHSGILVSGPCVLPLGTVSVRSRPGQTSRTPAGGRAGLSNLSSARTRLLDLHRFLPLLVPAGCDTFWHFCFSCPRGCAVVTGHLVMEIASQIPHRACPWAPDCLPDVSPLFSASIPLDSCVPLAGTNKY